MINKQLPEDAVEAKRITRRSKAFVVLQGKLYKKSITGILQRCVTDVASPMHDSAYYAIPGYVAADTIKIKFLFLFLPRKENVRDAIGVQYCWSMLSLKESGWGPPSSMLKMVAHLQKSLFILVYCLIF
jgi:hypothetical protein